MLSRHVKIYLCLFLVAMFLPEVVVAWKARKLVCMGYPDFTIFYSAARIVRYGLGPQLYDEATQLRVQREFVTGLSSREGPLPYNHPPFEALLFLPLTFLPYCAAFVVWDLVNLAILLGLPYLLRPHIALLRQVPIAACMLATVAFPATFVALILGQDSVLLLLLFALAFVALKRNSDWTAGVWLGLGLFRFHLLVPIVFCLLWQRRLRALVSFVGVGVVFAGISMATIGYKATLQYPAYVLHNERIMVQRSTVTPSNMPTLHGLLAIAHLSGDAKLVERIVGAVASILIIVLAAKMWRRTPEMAFHLGFALCLVATLLTAYHGLPHDLTLLLLAAGIVMDYALAKSAGGRLPLALLIPVFLLYCTPLETFLWFRTAFSGLIALVLLFWFWKIAREISSTAPLPDAQPVR